MVNKLETRVSRLAVPYLLLFPMLFFAVRAGSFSFQTGGMNSDLGATYGAMGGAGSDSTLSRFETLIVLAICAFLVGRLYQAVLKTCFEEKLIILLPLYATASALWSQDGLLSLRNGIYLFINTCFAIYLVNRFREDQMPRLMMFVGMAVALLSAFTAIAFPAYGVDHQGHEGAWQGLFSQKNACAQAMVFLLAPAFAIRAQSQTARFLRALYIALVCSIVVSTQSRTGIMIAVLYVGFILGLRFLSRFRGKDRSIVFFFGFSFLAIATVLVVNYLPALLALMGRDAGLTGRSQIWSAVFESILKHPLLGYGYAAFWTVLNGELSNIVVATGWVVTGAHNGFLNVWIELGAVGLSLVILTLVKAIKDAITCFRSGRSQLVNWYIGVIFLTVVYNLDEKTLVASQSLVWMIFLIACLGLSEAARKVRRAERTESLSRTIFSSVAA